MNAVATNNPWEIFASVRQDTLAFLEAQMLIPDTLYISGDGWAEAVYTFNGDTDPIMGRWNEVVEGKQIKVRKPIIDIEHGADNTRLRVHFNVYEKDSASMWDRIKKLVS